MVKGIINGVIMVKKGWWFNKRNLNVKEIFDGVFIVRSCSKYFGFGVIKLNVNFYVKVESF